MHTPAADNPAYASIGLHNAAFVAEVPFLSDCPFNILAHPGTVLAVDDTEEVIQTQFLVWSKAEHLPGFFYGPYATGAHVQCPQGSICGIGSQTKTRPAF